jgi:isochorismate pyruvate lyase
MDTRSPRAESAAPTSVVDAIDRQILVLLSQRLAMAREHGEGVWHEGEQRKSAISALRRHAFEIGVPVALVADFWDRLAEASVATYDQNLSQRRAIND